MTVDFFSSQILMVEKLYKSSEKKATTMSTEERYSLPLPRGLQVHVTQKKSHLRKGTILYKRIHAVTINF